MAVKAKAEITLATIRDVQSVTRYYLLQRQEYATMPCIPTLIPRAAWVKRLQKY